MKSVLVTLMLIMCACILTTDASAQVDPSGRRTTRPSDRRVSIPVQPTAYDLRCRGASRDMNTTPIFTVLDSRLSAGSNSTVTMAMDFERGLSPAGDRGEGLKPGQCAWVDRQYGGLEPITIRFETSANAQLTQMRNGSNVDRSPTAAERFPDKQTIPVYLSNSSHFWVFRVYNTNQGYLQAVTHQHWKPSASIADQVFTRRRDRQGGRISDTVQIPLPPEVNDPPLRPNQIRLVVRYSKEYGNMVPSGGTNYSSCGAFSIFGATMLEPVPGGFGSEKQVGSGARNGRLIDHGNYWLCFATIDSLPLDRDLKVYIQVHPQDIWRTVAWTGGANAQPPAGYERTITPGFQTVRLTARKPSEVVIFDMVYAPLPSSPR